MQHSIYDYAYHVNGLWYEKTLSRHMDIYMPDTTEQLRYVGFLRVSNEIGSEASLTVLLPSGLSPETKMNIMKKNNAESLSYSLGHPALVINLKGWDIYQKVHDIIFENNEISTDLLFPRLDNSSLPKYDEVFLPDKPYREKVIQ